MDTTKKITELEQRANLLRSMIKHGEAEIESARVEVQRRASEWVGQAKTAIAPALIKAAEIRPDATVTILPYYHNVADGIAINISVPDERYGSRDIRLTMYNSKPEMSKINAGSSEEVIEDAVVWYGFLSAVASAMPEIQEALSPLWGGWDYPDMSEINLEPVKEELKQVERKMEKLKTA